MAGVGLGLEGPSEGGTGGTGILPGKRGSWANLGLLAAVTTFQELRELESFNLGNILGNVVNYQQL